MATYAKMVRDAGGLVYPDRIELTHAALVRLHAILLRNSNLRRDARRLADLVEARERGDDAAVPASLRDVSDETLAAAVLAVRQHP